MLDAKVKKDLEMHDKMEANMLSKLTNNPGLHAKAKELCAKVRRKLKTKENRREVRVRVGVVASVCSLLWCLT